MQRSASAFHLITVLLLLLVSAQFLSAQTVTATLNGRKRVGLHVCADLSCKKKLEDLANRGGFSALPSVQKLVERMGRFASETLKIDLSGAGR